MGTAAIRVPAATLLLATALARSAAACTVPGVYASIQAAVDDLSCPTVTVAAGAFTESVQVSRDLTLQGAGSASTTIDGSVSISAGTSVHLQGLLIAGCGQTALVSEHGGSVTTFDVIATRQAAGSCANGDPIFADGFESGI